VWKELCVCEELWVWQDGFGSCVFVIGCDHHLQRMRRVTVQLAPSSDPKTNRHIEQPAGIACSPLLGFATIWCYFRLLSVSEAHCTCSQPVYKPELYHPGTSEHREKNNEVSFQITVNLCRNDVVMTVVITVMVNPYCNNNGSLYTKVFICMRLTTGGIVDYYPLYILTWRENYMAPDT